MADRICVDCGVAVECVQVASGVVWSDGDSSWCEARGPWKRHRVGEAVTPPKPRYGGKIYERERCPRPDKAPLERDAAEAEAAFLRGKGHPDIRAYECACNAWHVGKNKRETAKRARRVIASANYRMRKDRRGRR